MEEQVMIDFWNSCAPGGYQWKDLPSGLQETIRGFSDRVAGRARVDLVVRVLQKRQE